MVKAKKTIPGQKEPKINNPACLETIFTDPNWKRVNYYLYYNENEKIGAALATKTPNHDGFALNEGETHRVIAGKRDEKIEEAWVVAFKFNGSGPPTYVCAERAESVVARLEGRPTFNGKYGPFWVLQEYEIDPDAPF
jgi:hypothetical protein